MYDFKKIARNSLFCYLLHSSTENPLCTAPGLLTDPRQTRLGSLHGCKGARERNYGEKSGENVTLDVENDFSRQRLWIRQRNGYETTAALVVVDLLCFDTVGNGALAWCAGLFMNAH